MHFPIPTGNNPAGVTWTAALRRLDSPATVLSIIEDIEKAEIEVGTVLEYTPPANASPVGLFQGVARDVNLQTAFKEFYQREKARVIDKLLTESRYFGRVESGD